MDIIRDLLDIFLHLDAHLNQWAAKLGNALYGVLFLIIFCETGLVVTPFLPGDSLLFAAGALTSVEHSVLNLPYLALLLCVAAILGDSVNYSIGYRIGPRVFSRENSRFLNKRHLIRTQEFYARHGGKTIILARFIPIIRTFAPFVAGVGKMNYARFLFFNVTGGIIWVLSFLLGGHYFGNIPVIKRNFHIVIVAIIIISCIPGVIEFLRARKQAGKQTVEGGGPSSHPLPAESSIDRDLP
jgi:membrane-associated protein